MNTSLLRVINCYDNEEGKANALHMAGYLRTSEVLYLY